ncbi:MAG: hypothetical protein U0133_18680 [Gemmatimonadales bacterium]
MHCQLSALAEAANLSADGKINILGEFDTLWALGEPPVVHPSMVFVAKLKAGEADRGAHKIQLRVVDEDMKLVALLVDAQMQLQDSPIPGSEGGVPIIVPVTAASFPDFGTYEFQLLIDDDVKCRPQVHVRRRVPPPQA